MLKSYLKKIYDIAKHGDAREESYYQALSDLFKEFALSIEKPKIDITTLPKKTEAGNPDFRVWDGNQHIVGYIEAKAPTTEYLDQIETSEQLQRYLNTFPNLILTNFFEFRLYRNGNLTDKVCIARPFIIHKLKTVPPVEKEEEFFNLLDKFFSFSLPKVYNAQNLAVELAKRTRFLRDEVIAEELKEENEERGFILGFYEAFRKYLISGLTEEEFADLYSQTITYGLFAARTRSENGFNRKLAFEKIPRTVGILRDVFRFISLEDPPEQMQWIIDDISEVLAVTDVKKILHQYFHEGKGKDPIVHFYETFLAEYDPKTRGRRGVYYTPESVVSYIVRSLHHILKNSFKKTDGLADDTVTVLDPAGGTLTFLSEATKLAVEEFISKYSEGGENFIKDHILENFYALELMMAPYAVGHLKMSFLLEELGYTLKEDDRFKLYLTNTLEMEELDQTELPGTASLSEESHLAGKVKKEQPILIILGNPPYYGKSKNPSEKYVTEKTKTGGTKRKKIKTWIGKLIDDYKFIDGKPLGEKNPKWLQDDYVKFIRFAQWKIDQNGEGVLGFITNHSYLDNPTFRGMRFSLMNSFNEIYILDLHGSTLKKEKCPDGSRDQNVFDIQPGVAIGLFIKKKKAKNECKVYHFDKWGNREEKYSWVTKNSIKTIKWEKLLPKPEFYLFVPRDEKLSDSYEKYPKITEIFPLNSVGVATSRDSFVIDSDREKLIKRIKIFCNEKMTDEILKQTFNLKDKSDWNVKTAREKIKKDKNWQDSIVEILYRPFDVRWIFFHDALIERSRKEVMHHMLSGDNMALITTRLTKGETFKHVQITTNIAEVICMSSKTSNNGFVFPLYLYPQPEEKNLFSDIEALEEKKPNISKSFYQTLSKNYGKKPKAEKIFFYINSILYSNIYRKKYVEFLKGDFPRIPFTKDYMIFKKMGKYGERLVNLHLFESDNIVSPISKLMGKQDDMVEKVKYEIDKVYINQHQYFSGITQEIWEYQIGGYQVCDKWLKDRKNKILSTNEIKHYCRMVTAIEKTIEIQKSIDEIYPEVEKEIIQI